MAQNTFPGSLQYRSGVFCGWHARNLWANQLLTQVVGIRGNGKEMKREGGDREGEREITSVSGLFGLVMLYGWLVFATRPSSGHCAFFGTFLEKFESWRFCDLKGKLQT